MHDADRLAACWSPAGGEIRSSSTDDIAFWFIDSDYSEESFFVRPFSWTRRRSRGHPRGVRGGLARVGLVDSAFLDCDSEWGFWGIDLFRTSVYSRFAQCRGP